MADQHVPVRFGIIGYGNFAERAIAPAITATPGAALVAVQKRSLEAARAKAKELGIPLAFARAEDLVAHPDVDAVFIVSANSAHCAETVAAARAGKHVLVEKPMALNVGEAEEMIAACARQNVRLMVGHMIRFSPLVRRMREVVRSGLLGTLVSARADFIYDARLSQRGWLRERGVAGGGPVYDVGVHCLDSLRYVLDDEVETVRSVLDPLPTAERTEESAHLLLRFSRGTLGSIFCSYAAPVRRKEIEILGMDGRMTAGEFTVGGITARLTIDTSRDSRPAEPVEEVYEVPNLYVEEISHFIEAIRTGSPLLTPGENGLANQRVLDRAVAGTR
ncbi:MAG TPA: Gfo/Idh/MocA family oxidoreductase [Bacteroidota bacterium]|nr:Gfo/Idh/MocA family oxidoreductase [Bacteroidota bacterium]